MLHLVLGALVTTRLTDVSAQAADGLRMFAATGHRCDGQLADRSAIHVHCDASRHHLHVLFLQTGGSAVVAGYRTGVAGFDA